MTLIATTLGIIPSKPQGHPIPTLNKEEAIEMRKAGGADLDSWEYFQFRLLNHNTKLRIQSALEAANEEKGSKKEEIILRRLEKGRSLDENPSSLATVLSHRTEFTREVEESKQTHKDKKATIAIACNARNMDMASIAACTYYNIQRT